MPHNAGIAQLVEHNLAKVGVASSSLVSRSENTKRKSLHNGGFFVLLNFYTSSRITYPCTKNLCERSLIPT